MLAHVDKPSGYQGTIYQRVDTGEIVVAHRGTEFDRQKLQDLVKTDGGMVLSRTNDQANDAIDLTREALEIADRLRSRGTDVPNITVTGHSLGGTLAQISGHYFGLKGETFNAYGAASLNIRHPTTGELYRLPEGGHGMLNHVTGADLVSSGSTHYGQTRVYTNQREIDTPQKYGYANNDSRWMDRRNDVVAAGAAMRGGSHDMDDFLPWDGDHRPDRPILEDPGARTLAAQYDPMIDKFRADVVACECGSARAGAGDQPAAHGGARTARRSGAGLTDAAAQRWQRGHQTLARWPIAAWRNGPPQRGQASPPRPYTDSSCSK